MTALRLIAVTLALLIVALGVPGCTVAALSVAGMTFALAVGAFIAAALGQAK